MAASVFDTLKPAFGKVAKRLALRTDTATCYLLVSQRPSPFPQHKGHPMEFGAVRTGKAYVSVHLMPIYMNPELNSTISPALKKRMQGKACFNFKAPPEPAILSELKALIEASYKQWSERGWA